MKYTSIFVQRNESREFLQDFKKVYTTLNMTESELQLKNSIQYIIGKFTKTLKKT